LTGGVGGGKVNFTMYKDKLTPARGYDFYKKGIKMKKITLKFIAEVKRSNKKNWHDQEWHDFQGSVEVWAVNYAINDVGLLGDNDDIKKSAIDYLTWYKKNLAEIKQSKRKKLLIK
jgi:hypothetical protein